MNLPESSRQTAGDGVGDGGETVNDYRDTDWFCTHTTGDGYGCGEYGNTAGNGWGNGTGCADGHGADAFRRGLMVVERRRLV